MARCGNCGSKHVIKKGPTPIGGRNRQRYKCKNCHSNFYEFIEEGIIPQYVSKKKVNTWVITTCINNADTNTQFVESLHTYCEHNDADLLIIPLKYTVPELNIKNVAWDSNLEPYFYSNTVHLLQALKLLAGMKISPTVTNPFAGWNDSTKGISHIIPSPQIRMAMVARNQIDTPCALYTTGCVSYPVYTKSKQGERATFNHSFAALVVEEDPSIESFHVRVLNCDNDGGFYDVDKYYFMKSISSCNKVSGIVIGDEHVKFIDQSVAAATYYNTDSMVNTLRPEYLIRHDVLDFYSASHHHKTDIVLQFAKLVNGDNDVEKELKTTIEYLIDTTPSDCTSIIVESNHNGHLDKWISSADAINKDLTNYCIYHDLSRLIGYHIKQKKESMSLFELWSREYYDYDNIRFLKNAESFKLHDIELSMHGDHGLNGSKGSTAQFARLGLKVITGHTHVPAIIEGAYSVGHSCISKMEYNKKSPSSWHHGHCIIHPNGKRQMILIKEGKWRR